VYPGEVRDRWTGNNNVGEERITQMERKSKETGEESWKREEDEEEEEEENRGKGETAGTLGPAGRTAPC